MDEFILREMEDQKERALKSLSSILPMNHNINEVITCVLFAYLEGCPSATHIIEEANLYPIDLAALLDDEEKYIDLWTQEEENRIGEMLYDNSIRD